MVHVHTMGKNILDSPKRHIHIHEHIHSVIVYPHAPTFHTHIHTYFIHTTGDYTIQMQPISGILISPERLRVSTRTAPVLDVHFGQASLHIKGTVTCVQQCDSSVEVTVAGKETTRLKLDARGAFSLENAAPGKYTIVSFVFICVHMYVRMYVKRRHA
jgi:hypothetical protein